MKRKNLMTKREAKATIMLLEESGHLKRNYSLLWMIVTLVVSTSFIGTLFYLGATGSFGTEVAVNQSVSLEPEINVSINNEYEFNPETEIDNRYSNNFTIINNIICP